MRGKTSLISACFVLCAAAGAVCGERSFLIYVQGDKTDFAKRAKEIDAIVNSFKLIETK